MNKIWVVAAESSRARLFSAPSLQGSLTEMDGMTHPESRLHTRELITDHLGRTNDSHGARHNIGTDYDPKQHEAELFAKEIASRVEEGRIAGKFSGLVLIASPEFLGMLRAALTDTTRQKIVKSIHKNLVLADLDSIRKNMFD
jgi:protein required for attachment to host cells